MPAAAPATTDAAKIIAEIERLDFTYHEVSAYDLSQLSPQRRVQVREPEHYAPKDQVERYAVQMGESVFPPIVVTEDGWIVDGNTRVGAKLWRREKLKDDKFLPAIVLDIAFKGATEKKQRELYALAATLNSKNGEPLTPKERRTVSEKLILLGWNAENIARAIGASPAVVTQVKQEIAAVDKFRLVGLSNGHMRGQSLRALGKSPVLALSNEPYKYLAEFAGAAGLNAKEIMDFAKQAKATGSDQGAIDLIRAAQAEMTDRIREHNLTGVSKPPLARQLRQHLGFVTRFVEDEGALVETHQPVIEQHIATIETAIAVLTATLAAQKAR